ncbi:hypothetical protein JKA73_27140 [Myxococcus xanthus]|uniref:hypothetical protein n=1 Tax=Myxococcus xanthus TaxID=34 RepID=UPI0009438875|nr:hypothetical protein [Myxococcus xanthus]QQR42728.1 hypothetical protein JKA73_27140 [Myxococcus xanthus]
MSAATRASSRPQNHCARRTGCVSISSKKPLVFARTMAECVPTFEHSDSTSSSLTSTQAPGGTCAWAPRLASRP